MGSFQSDFPSHVRPRPAAFPPWSGLLRVCLAVCLSGLGAVSAAAQETGRIAGRVTSSQSGAPVGEVQVFLPGTGLGSLSRQNGAFVILEVPAGTHEIRAERIGLAAVTQQVTVVAGQTAEVNFELTTQALGLDEIVVTGTAGASRRREIGNTIAQINTAEIPQRTTDVTDLLQAAAPGIQVTAVDGGLGQGSNIRLRGNTSVSMSNQPIIYVDGIRMQSEAFPIGRASAAGTSGSGGNIEASPLNNINPNDIERIEVIKGSAATTLYGTEASAGVIQIFTKRGSAGAPVWSLETQQSLSRSLKIGTEEFPYHRIDPYLSTGHIGNYSASVRGGGEALQYFASAQHERGTGILPQDTISKWGVRGNFTFTPGAGLQLQWNTSYAFQGQRNTPVGGNANGITHNAYRGYANYFNSEDPEVVSQLFTQDIRQAIERFTTGATLTYSPLANLTNRLTVGYDFSQQEVRNIRPFGYVFFENGSIFNDKWENRLLTFDYVGTYSFGLTEAIRSSFSWGGQAVGDDERRLNGYGIGLPPAAKPTVSSSATQFAYEDRSKVWNAGFFFQNVFDIRDRYFVTVGMRVDGNSAFGSGFGLQVYPKASASWVASDEAFWQDGWGTVKLRAAYGQSGRAPGAFDAVRTWNSKGWTGRTALVPGNLGSPDLGPEVTAEYELGFDAAWLDGRLAATFTYYDQTTTDALFNVSQVPSNGFGGSQRLNVGEISNRGMEISVSGAPVRSADWGWDVGVNVTTNKSEVIDLGGIPAFSTGGGWIQEGHPVPALRGEWVTNADEIAAPIIEEGHIFGPTQPTLTVAPSTTVRLPGGISLSALGEFRGGMYMEDGLTDGGVSRSAWMPICWPYYVNPYSSTPGNYEGPGPEHTLALKPDTPALWRATCTPSLSEGSFSTRKADYFKLRSVSAVLPVGFAFPDRVSNAALTLAVNNFWSWYNDEWGVLDPDMAGNADSLTQGPGSRPPPVWSFNASLRVQF